MPVSPAASRLAPPKVFRPEIEGVRIIAALLVAGYHTWSGRVSGGVDVFFVMSGFLITTSLMSQLARDGRIDLLAFARRLALRLLPAAMTVLAAVLLASWLFLPDVLRESTAREVRAAALYGENVYLAATSTDYLAAFAEKTPVEHFWALSLQGQFYVVWGLLFLAVAAVVRRGAAPVRTLAVVLATLFATSLAFSIWFTIVDQPVAYFIVPSRVWEFALGGLAALALRRPPTGRSVLRWTLGWVGLAILLTTGLILQVSTVFPGYAALLPTTAALMILVSARSGFRGADTLLSTRPLVWLGGISYGIYLWHFPLLVISRQVTSTESTSLTAGLALIGAAIVLAWLTQRWIERPVAGFARRGTSQRRLAVLVLVATVVMVATVATATARSAQDPEAAADLDEVTETLSSKAFDLDPCTGAAAGLPENRNRCAAQPGTDLVPRPGLVEQAQEPLPCDPVVEDGPLTVCDGGSSSPEPRATVLMVGDSHAVTMRPALELVAQRHGWRMLFTYSPGCQTAAVPKEGPTASRCAAWVDGVTEYLERPDTDVDVLFSIQAAGRDLTGAPEDDPVDFSVASYREQWDRYGSSIDELVVLRDTPRMRPSTLGCVAQADTVEVNASCSRDREAALMEDYAAVAAETDGDESTRVVDLTDAFCGERRCYPVSGNYLAYVDAAHLSTVFSPTLAPLLDERIAAALTPERRELLFDDHGDGSSASG